MFDADVPAATLATVEAVAGAIRRELGAEVDAYPGFRSPEAADPVNRVFRAMVRTLLTRDDTSTADLPARVSRILRRVAERRLGAEGLDDSRVRDLIEQEPGSPDDWLAFVILSSWVQIEPLLEPTDPDLP